MHCRLQRKGVQCIASCPMCDGAPENEWHLFFGCPKAREVWEASNLWELICDDFEVAEGMNDLLFKLLEIFDSNTRTDLAAIIWCLWGRRNDKV